MSEERRYLEYLQKRMMPDGWAGAFEAEKSIRQLSESTRWKEDPAYGGVKPPAVERLAAFQPQTKFDSPMVHGLIRPILDDLLGEANRQPQLQIGTVQLVASTDPSPTPVARPSSAGHMLFIGVGTLSYCNYWSKVFAPIIVHLFTTEQSFRIRSEEEIEAAAAKGHRDSIDLAAALCVHFALFRTTMLFGRVTSLPEHLHYRMEMVTAMERFIVAHELSHFIAHTALPGADGMMTPEDQKTVELFCDDLGLALSRGVAADKNCFLGRSGVAAMLFFRTIAWGDDMRRKIGLPIDQTGSHPPCDERIELIRARVMEFDNDRDGLKQMIDFYDSVFTSIISLANRRIEKSVG